MASSENGPDDFTYRLLPSSPGVWIGAVVAFLAALGVVFYVLSFEPPQFTDTSPPEAPPIPDVKADALSLAERLSPAFSRAARKPVFVDFNAINPRTTKKVAQIVQATGALFVDADHRRASTRWLRWASVLLSGVDAKLFEALARLTRLRGFVVGKGGFAPFCRSQVIDRE